MASLAQVTQSTRVILKWVGIAFAVFLVVRFLFFPLGKNLYNRLFPKTPPPPTAAFGRLPQIQFPKENRFALPTGGFAIKTTLGILPPTCLATTCITNDDPTQPKNIPDRINVYSITRSQAKFSSYDRAKQKVASINFKGEGTPISQAVYQWQDSEVAGRQIRFNTITEEFTLTSPIASSSSDIEQSPPPPAAAISIAKNFLSRMSLLPQDLDDMAAKTTLLKISDGALTKATSLSESHYVQINFYRKPLANLPIVYPDPQESLISFLIKTDRNDILEVAKAKYAYKLIDQNQSSTYPVKSSQEALSELEENKGYIAKNQETGPQVTIQKVYLAYYEGADDSSFLLPVFVFEGENFLAYVSAIRTEWVE